MPTLSLKKLKLKQQINKFKIVSNAVQDDITNELIECIQCIRDEKGVDAAYKTADVFMKAIHLFRDGVPMTTALLAVSELNNGRKNVAKILGLAALCVTSIIPSLIINQETFEEYVDDLYEDLQNEKSRNYKKRLSNITSIKRRTKKK